VLHNFPDLVIPEEDEEDKTAAAAAAAAEEDPAAKPGEDGLDSQWNKRMKDRLERMKSKKIRDVSLTVTQKSGLTGALSSRQRRTYNKDDSTTTGQGRVREELSQKSGKVHFLTGQNDGTVEICVQSVLASIKNPARFALRVSMAAAPEPETAPEASEEGKDGSKEGLAHAEITSNLSRLDRDLQTLHNRVKACLNNADFNKDQEAAFHNQSVDMNRAATYWPLIQLMILIITGFTQANHIVRYLKTHHIGI
jgi:hypothetical protein